MNLIRRLIDWFKHKLGYLTSSDLLEYKKYLQFPEIYKSRFLFSKLHEKIHDKVFSQYSKDEKTCERIKYGLHILYEGSDLFADIVNNSILWAIEKSPNDVGHFKYLAFKHIKQESYINEKEIRSSVAIKNSQMTHNLDPWLRSIRTRLRSTKLSEGYSTIEIWNEFFTKIKQRNI